jgi:transcriptional regulator with XRE-family HTH domain
MDLGKAFVRNMKNHRKRAELSQEKLAELCNASHSYIRQIECGSRYPSFNFIGRLASALNIPVSLLFSDEDDEKNHETVQKENLESELIETIVQDVHSAFSKMK